MRLHEQVLRHRGREELLLEEIQWMREHLASPKFQGELEDVINVRDVDAFCIRLRSILYAD